MIALPNVQNPLSVVNEVHVVIGKVRVRRIEGGTFLCLCYEMKSPALYTAINGVCIAQIGTV